MGDLIGGEGFPSIGRQLETSVTVPALSSSVMYGFSIDRAPAPD